MFTSCNLIFAFQPNLSKAKAQFDNGSCEKSLRYVLGKFTSDEKENKIIDDIKNSNEKVKSIFNNEQFDKKECVYAIKYGLAEAGCSNSNIDDIMLKVAPEVMVGLSSDNTCQDL